MKTTYLNYTPHSIMLNSGEIFESKGVARVSSEHTEIVNNECKVIYGDVTGLPEPKEGVKYIVSAIVFQASDREDLVAPATGHPDVKRNEKGHIISVPCFVTK